MAERKSFLGSVYLRWWGAVVIAMVMAVVVVVAVGTTEGSARCLVTYVCGAMNAVTAERPVGAEARK